MMTVRIKWRLAIAIVIIAISIACMVVGTAEVPLSVAYVALFAGAQIAYLRLGSDE